MKILFGTGLGKCRAQSQNHRISLPAKYSVLQAIEKLQAGALATDAVTAALIELEV